MIAGRSRFFEREDIDPPAELKLVVGPPLTDLVLTREASKSIVAVTRFTLLIRTVVTETGPERFCAAPPDRDPDQCARLDDRGVARVGAEVGPGDLLVGVVAPLGAPPSDLSDQLGALFGEELEVRDVSSTCPDAVRGVVVEASVTDEGGRATARVTIEVRSAARVGDAAAIDGVGLRNIAAIVEALPDAADAALPGVSGRRVVRFGASAAERIRARSIGPYEPATSQPHGPAVRRGGQVVDRPRVRRLLEAGLFHNLGEIYSLKSDDPDGRALLYTALVRGEPVPAPALPRGATLFGFDLKLCGLAAQMEGDEIAVRPLNDFDREHNAEPLACTVAHPWALEAAGRLLGRATPEIRRSLERSPTGALELREELARIDLAQLVEDPSERGALARGMVEGGVEPRHLVYASWPRMVTNVELPDNATGAMRGELVSHFRLLERQSFATAQALSRPDTSRTAKARATAALQRAVDAAVNGTSEDTHSLVDRLRFRCLRRTVDFSAIAPAVGLTDAPRDEARVPRTIALTVFAPLVYEWLERHGHVARIREARDLVEASHPLALEGLEAVATRRPVLLFISGAGGEPHLCARRARLWDELAIGLDLATCAMVGAGRRVAELHLPTGTAAREEADAFVDDAARPLAWAAPRGWIARAAWAERPDRVLMSAALAGEVDRLEDPWTRAFLGRSPL